MVENCPICTEPLENDVTTLECGHAFHTKCIIRWFRRGNSAACPMCRDLGRDDNFNLSYFDVQARCSYLRRKARNKSAPTELKRLYKKLRKAELREKEILKELSQFHKTYKEQRKQYRKLRSMRWRMRRTIDMAKRTLGLFNSAEFPIPIVAPRRGRGMFLN